MVNFEEKMENKKDRRVGLFVRPIDRSHENYYDLTMVIDVLPSGTNGIVDEKGVLVIRLNNGDRTTLQPASDWKAI